MSNLKIPAALFLVSIICSCAGQKYRDFKTPTPLPDGHALILGFQGGRDSWNDPRPGVARLAAKLRSLNLEAAHIEVVENTKRELALKFIRNAFDRDRNRKLSSDEKANSRIVIYGMSFGGAAVVKLAREMENASIPILLTVQVDSVGRGDSLIPENVRRAANLFQRTGKIIHGEPEVKAEDPVKTEIIGNFEFDYKNSNIDISKVPWYKKIFRGAHTKMDRDPEVWRKVEELILGVLDQE
jgi:hypothetical protein